MRIPSIISVILITIVAFSCKKGTDLGREVQVGDNDILLLTSDSFHISARTVEASRERTDERFEGMVGAYFDPIFGPSIISYATVFHLEQEGFDFGPSDSIVFDSAFVSLRLNGGYREKDLDSEEPTQVHFKVYELGQEIYLDSIYYSNTKIRINPNLVGEYIGPLNVNDSVITEEGTQPPQLRIKLDDAWGEALMRAGPNVYESNENFVKYLNGLAIVPEIVQSANGNGAILYFSPLSVYSAITLHFHTNSDTTKFKYVTDATTANYSHFEHDYSASQIGSVFGDTAVGSEQLYLQATIGTDVELELKDIVAQFGANPKIINLAELIIPVDSNQPYQPVPKLSLSRKLENGTAEFLPDQVETGYREIDGRYDDENNRYRFRITQYIQEIIHNYDPNNDKSEILLVSPFGNNTLANRSVVYGPRPSMPDAEKMKIVITYTPLN